MLKLYRNVVAAGLLGMGLAACGDKVTVTQAPTPTPGVTSVTVAPANITIAINQTVAFAASVIADAGVATSVNWSSGNSAIATVDAAGNVKGIAAGTTTIVAASTADAGKKGIASVTVSSNTAKAATLSISSVTTGNLATPVVLTNVVGQIEVNMNFTPGDQQIDSIAVFVGAKRANKASYASSPAAGLISLSIPTNEFTKNITTGVATVSYLNGNSSITAVMYGGTTATATSAIPIRLNNADGWAADITKPTVNAASASTSALGAGITFWGGPTAPASATIYPVIYTPGRSVSTVTWTLGAAGGGSCSTVTQTATPFTRTFGATGATACAYENITAIRDNILVTASLDNNSNTFPLVNGATPLIANSVMFAACSPAAAGCVTGSTPDSLRLDYKAPSVGTPSIARTAPAVTGWVNASFSFINFTSTDAGVGIRATRDRATTYSGCGAAAGTAMGTGTGADIPECASNTIGGAAGLGSPGTAPYRVVGTESDRLGNIGTSSATQTFGVDKTTPSIRWGLNTGVYAAQVVVAVDSQFRAAKPAAADEYRVEYLDENLATGVTSGFYNAGAPLAGVSAQRHALSTAGHANNAGLCTVGTGPIGATFVTAPACTMAAITVGGTLRVDGWQGGMSVPNTAFNAEGYWGYASNVTDEAGNVSSTLFRKAVVSTISPYATGLTVPATLSATNFVFGPTFADSTEIVRQSLQVEYPDLLTLGATSDSLRYSRTSIGTVFDDVITSPFLSQISPNTGTPYVRRIEAVNANAFPANNVQAAPANVKPTSVVAWSWNPGSILTGGPAAGRSLIIPIPGLLVQDGVSFATFNTGNTINPVTHFRIIATVATTNQFGSTAPLRAQAVSPTNTPNAPFARVDFYRRVTVGPDTWWSYLGSSTTAIGTDQGTYRSWVYNAPGTFLNAWNGTAAQAAVAAADVILAVGVTAAGDGLAATVTMTP